MRQVKNICHGKNAALLVFVFLLLCFVGLVVAVVFFLSGGKFMSDQLVSDYDSLGAFDALVEFVQSNKGELPASWDDLGEFHGKESVVIDFSINREDILTDEKVIYDYIRPIKGSYIFYPHHDRHYQELLGAIRSFGSLGEKLTPGRVGSPIKERQGGDDGGSRPADQDRPDGEEDGK